MEPEQSGGRLGEDVKFAHAGIRRELRGRLDQSACVPAPAEFRKDVETPQPRVQVRARLAVPVEQADRPRDLFVFPQDKGGR